MITVFLTNEAQDALIEQLEEKWVSGAERSTVDIGSSAGTDRDMHVHTVPEGQRQGTL